MGLFDSTNKTTNTSETVSAAGDNGAITANSGGVVTVTDGGAVADVLDFAGKAFGQLTDALGVYAGQSIQAVSANSAESIQYANTSGNERTATTALYVAGGMAAVMLLAVMFKR